MGGVLEFIVWAAATVAAGGLFVSLVGNPLGTDDRTLRSFGGAVFVWALVADALIATVWLLLFRSTW